MDKPKIRITHQMNYVLDRALDELCDKTTCDDCIIHDTFGGCDYLTSDEVDFEIID